MADSTQAVVGHETDPPARLGWMSHPAPRPELNETITYRCG